MKSKSKFLFRMMIIVILVFSSALYACHDLVLSVQDNKESTIESFKEEQFKVIWNNLKELQDQSKANVTKISDKIEKDILALPDDNFSKIQTDMTNGVYNKDLHDIFMKNIENQNLNNINNHRNGIVIMYNDGYLEDFNYRRATINDNNDNSGIYRSWDDTISASYNKDLEKNAIDKILNRTSGIIALESYDLTGNDNHIKINDLNYDTLLKVYSKEGINGLKNYQILIPYYITDIGDIFGVPDISQGMKVDNNKIIIIQEFNLYDQLMVSKPELFSDDAINDIQDRYTNIFRWYYLVGFLMIMSICIIIFIACFIYNNAIEQEETIDYYLNKMNQSNNNEDTEQGNQQNN